MPPAWLMFWSGLIAVVTILVLIADPVEDGGQERTIRVERPDRPVGSIKDPKLYMLKLVNNEREKAGVQPVKLGDNQAAQLHAEAAIKGCYFSHWDKWGLKPNHRYTLAGGTGASAENVSGHRVCPGPRDDYTPVGNLSSEVADSVSGLMRSRGHRENILDPAHTHLNAGIAHDHYNKNVVQQFSAEYVNYEEKPHIDESGTLRLKASSKGASFEIGNVASIQIYYDQPPQPLTRGQMYQTYCYFSGPQAAYIVEPRSSFPEGGTIEVEERQSIARCTDPYDVDPSSKVPSDPARAQKEKATIKARALEPRENVENVHKVAAKTLERSDEAIRVEANLKEVLEFHGPGIYSIVIWGIPNHMNENLVLSEYSIFWQVEPPEGNPYDDPKQARAENK